MYRVLAYLLVAPLYVLSLLPLRVHYLFADIIALLLHRVVRYRREVIDANLAAAFPDMPQKERDKLARDYYKYLADVICEMVWAMTRSGRYLRRKCFMTVDPAGEELLNAVFRGSSSVVTLLSHTGNWELASDLPAYMQHSAFSIADMTVAYQPLHSPLSEQLFGLMRRKRLSEPGSLVPSNTILRYMLERRSQRRAYFFIADQYPLGGLPATTTFMGLETEWARGAEAVARKLQLPVLYVFIDRVKRGGYVIKISQICSDASLTGQGEVTSAYSALLERDILSRRESWLWSHRRWKNKNLYTI